VLKLGQSLDDLGKDFDASILLYPDSNDDQVIMATRDNGSKVTISKNGFAFMKNPAMSKNVVEDVNVCH
jgi:hypothetical protein